MLRTFEHDSWILEVDKERTAELYQTMPLLSEECGCAYCLNFVRAYPHFPLAVKEFFELFGIDPRREGEVYQLDDQENPVHYAGFFHFVGRIIEADAGHPLKMGKGFEASFNSKNELLPEGWEDSAVQLEFDFKNVPWEFELRPDELYKKLH